MQEIFASQSEFLTNRNRYHKQSVPACENIPKGKCIYTNENENKYIEIEENKEVI
jgi:hypothetical protein